MNNNMGQKVKVIYIISADVFGGKEAQLYSLLKELRNFDLYIKVVLFNKGILYNRLSGLGIDLVFLNEKDPFIKNILLLRKLLKQDSYDLIISENYKESILACLSKLFLSTKLVLHFHGALEYSTIFKNFKLSLYYSLYKFISKYCAVKNIVPCSDLINRLGLDDKNSKVIYNSYVQVDDKSDEGGEIIKSPNIIWMARLVKIKRADFAIRVFKKLMDKYSSIDEKPTLYLLGAGEEEPNIKLLVEELDLANQVKLLGFKDNPEDYLKQANLLLITSSQEAMPTILLDAIKYNIPIVASAVGGIPEVMGYFPDYPCLLINPENATEFVDSLYQFININPSKITKDNKEVLVNTFSPNVIAKKHLELYHSLMEK